MGLAGEGRPPVEGDVMEVGGETLSCKERSDGPEVPSTCGVDSAILSSSAPSPSTSSGRIRCCHYSDGVRVMGCR